MDKKQTKTFYHPNGSKSKETSLDSLHGKTVTTWYDNGQIQFQSKEHQDTTKITKWYADGQIKEKSLWSKGVLSLNRWYETGQKKQEIACDDSGIKTDTSYYFGGQMSQRKVFDGSDEIEETRWSSAGIMTYEKNLSGYKLWFENGRKKLDIIYSERSIEWYENGQIKEEINNTNSTYSVWHKDGQKMSEEFFYKNEKIDKKTIWHKNGLALIEVKTLNGKRHGKQTQWLSNGKKFFEKTYENGVLINSWRITDEMCIEESIRFEFIMIREIIDVLNGSYLETAYSPVQNFPDKEKYPLEYQIYMEEIGDQHMGDGYLFIDIHEPVSCFSSNADDYIFTSYISPETPNEIIDLEAMDGSGEINAQASSYNVVAADCYLGTYGFYIGKEPFQFVATPSDSYYGSDFLEFLKDVLNSCLEYASCPILNNLGRESNGHLAQLF